MKRQPYKIQAGSRLIGEGEPVFVIAEAGINHNGDMGLAEELIRAAKANGADAIKFQTYRTEKRVAKESPIFGILKQCELSFDQQRHLAALAADTGILFFSTPFDEECADFLVENGALLMKIASFDLVHLQLLRHVASKGIPTIMSRGMADVDEINRAVKIFKAADTPLALLHCVSSYPNREEDAHIRVIGSMAALYDCPVGYSDHTLGIEAPVLSVACGATIIEKHFTLDREMQGPDHAMSCDPATLRRMTDEIRRAERILGSDEIKLQEAERGTQIYRRHTK